MRTFLLLAALLASPNASAQSLSIDIAPSPAEQALIVGSATLTTVGVGALLTDAHFKRRRVIRDGYAISSTTGWLAPTLWWSGAAMLAIPAVALTVTDSTDTRAWAPMWGAGAAAMAAAVPIGIWAAVENRRGRTWSRQAAVVPRVGRDQVGVQIAVRF